MNELQDLYQELILDHNRRPRNCRRIEQPSCEADGHNPLCGDRIKVYLHLDGGVVKDVSFEGSGCAISTASASLMTEAVKGKPIQEVEAIFHQFHDLVMGKESTKSGPDLGKLKVFSSVSNYPARVKCATLSWHTLEAALHHQDEIVSTE